MKEELIEVIDTYDKEGYLVKKTANGSPIFIPKKLTPDIQIFDQDTEWVIKKVFMTAREHQEYLKSITPQS